MEVGASAEISSTLPLLIPSRAHTRTADGHCFPLTCVADFAADNGFDGIDLSLDTWSLCNDDSQSILYALALRVAARGLVMPLCHLPFYMPTPDDRGALSLFARQQTAALKAAAWLGIRVAVIHPIVRHSSVSTSDAWLQENLSYLAPLRDTAAALDVVLAVENMAGKPYPHASGEAVFGSRAEHLMALCDRLDTGVCWDFGHANLTGLVQAPQIAIIGPRLRVVHIHDNDGIRDAHLIPGRGTVDWHNAMTALRDTGFLCPEDAANPAGIRCMSLELKTSDLPADNTVRETYAAEALCAARCLLTCR